MSIKAIVRRTGWRGTLFVRRRLRMRRRGLSVARWARWANLDQACPGTIVEQTDTRRRGVANDVKRLTGRAPLGLAAFLASCHTLMQTHEPGPTPPQQSPELAMHVCGVSRTLT